MDDNLIAALAAPLEPPIHQLAEDLGKLRELKDQKSKELKDLNDEYDAKKQALLKLLQAMNYKSLKTDTRQLVRVTREIVTITDWETFCNYVSETKSFHLLRKQPSSTACKELETITGTAPPGTQVIAIEDLTISKTRKANDR